MNATAMVERCAERQGLYGDDFIPLPSMAEVTPQPDPIVAAMEARSTSQPADLS